jgi:hypothetical protein
MKKEIFKISLLYLLLVIVVFRGHFDGSATFFSHGDASVQSVAWLGKIENSLLKGELPFWDFDTDSGTSFIGEMQTSVLYPPVWLMAISPPYKSIVKLEIFVMLHFFWAALGAYIFFRQIKLGSFPAFIGGIFFAFIGPAALRVTGQPNLHAGVVQIPWMLTFALMAIQETQVQKRYFYWSLMSLVSALAILAGHMHAYIHGILAVAILVVFASNQKIKDYFRFTLAFLFSLVLAAGQLIPTAQYFNLAYKWYGVGFTEPPHIVPFEEFGRYSLRNFASLLDVTKSVPEAGTLFVTFSGLVLVVLGLFYIFYKQKNKYLLFVPGIVFISLIIAFAGDNFLGKIIHQIPFLNIVRIPLRALHLYSFRDGRISCLWGNVALG